MVEGLKVNLGCGKKKKDGWIGIDQEKWDCVDIVCNIDDRILLEDNSVNKLYSSHVLEHVEDFTKIMEEIYRICKNNAIIEIKVPHFSGSSGFYVYHKRFFRFDSFDEFDHEKKSMFANSIIYFKTIEKRIIFDKKWFSFYNFLVEELVNQSKFSMKMYEATFLRNLFPAFEIYFKLKVVK